MNNDAEILSKLKSMGWRPRQVIKGGKRIDTRILDAEVDWLFKGVVRRCQSTLAPDDKGRWTLHWTGEVTGGVPGRQAEQVEVFEDPIAATAMLKIEGDGDLGLGAARWREETWGPLGGQLMVAR